jgi:hypothetical protein
MLDEKFENIRKTDWAIMFWHWNFHIFAAEIKSRVSLH